MASGTQSYEMTSGDFAGDMIDKILSRKAGKDKSSAQKAEPGGALIATPNKSLFVSGTVSDSPISSGAIVPNPGGDLTRESPGSLAVRDAILGVTVSIVESAKLLKEQTLLLKGGFDEMSNGFRQIALPTSAIVKSVDGIGFVNIRILDAIEEQTDTQKRIAATQLAEQRQLAAEQRLARNERRLEAGQDLSDSQAYKKRLLPAGGGGAGGGGTSAGGAIQGLGSFLTGLAPSAAVGKAGGQAVKAGQTGVRAAMKLPALPPAKATSSALDLVGDVGKFVPDATKIGQVAGKTLGIGVAPATKFFKSAIGSVTSKVNSAKAGLDVLRAQSAAGALGSGGFLSQLKNFITGPDYSVFSSDFDDGADILRKLVGDPSALQADSAAKMTRPIDSAIVPAGKTIDVVPPGSSAQMMQQIAKADMEKVAAMRVSALDDAGYKATEIATDQLVKQGTKQGLRRGSGLARMMVKQFGAAGTKSILKKIPVVAGIAGILFGIQRAMEGDFFGAGLEITSGLMGATGVGAGASLGIDGYLLARDFGMTPFAEGGIVTGRSPVNALIGETGQAEAVMPLTDDTFLRFGEGMLEAQRKNERVSSAVQAKGMEKFYRENNSWWDGLVEAFRKLLPGFLGGGEDVEAGKTNNVNKDKTKKTNNSDGGDGGDAPIASNATKDQALLAAISALEGGNAQARADVAQSIYNRAADPNKRYGSSISEVILSDAQYQPAYVNPNASSGSGTRTADIWKKVTGRDSAIDAMMSYFQKRDDSRSRESVAKLFDQTMAALGNRDMQIKAAELVGGRTEFLGANSAIDRRDRAEVRTRGSGADNQFFTAYGTGGENNESIKRGAAAVPEGLFPERKPVTPPPPPPVPEPKNFFLEYFEKVRKKDRQSSLDPTLMTPYQRQQYGFTAFTPPSATALTSFAPTISQPAPSAADSSNQQIIALLSTMNQQQRVPTSATPPSSPNLNGMGRKPTVDQNANMYTPLTLQRLNA